MAKQLFWAKPLFCRALLDVGTQLADISAVRSDTSDGTASHMYQLDEYSDLQVAQREQITRPRIEAIIEHTQQVWPPPFRITTSLALTDVLQA